MSSRRPLVVAVVAGVAVAMAVGVWGAADRLRSGDGPVRRPIGGDSIVMLGDSITAGGDWDSLLAGRPVVNQGYPGFTTAELLPIAADVAESSPDTVFVLAGTNDVRDGLPPARTQRDLGAILDMLAAASPPVRVVIQTVLPRAATSTEIVATNEAIVALAAERELEVLDLYREFDDGTGGLRPEETTDGWHLSDRGYQRWAELLEERLAG